MNTADNMTEFKAGVERLEDEHFVFIQAELGITPEKVFSFTDEEVNERIYEPMCNIEIEETLKDDEEETERGFIASDIVTILGNSMAEANGWIEEDNREGHCH